VIGQMPVGSSVVVTFSGTLTAALQPRDTWQNRADMTYTSLPGTQGTANATPGNSGDDNGERNGSDGVGGAVDDYAGTDTVAAFTSLSPTINKVVDATSTSDANTGTAQHNGAQQDLAPGETFRYILTITLPEG